MGNTQSFWDQVDIKNASQINTISEGFLDFLNSAKTESEARDFLIRRLLHYRFHELRRVVRPTRGSGFVVELDNGCFAAGVFGRADLTKRGISIVGVPIYQSSVEMGPRSPAILADMGLSAVRFTPAGDFLWNSWSGINVSLHILKQTREGVTKDIVTGASRKSPGYIVMKASDGSQSKSGKATGQYDIITGSVGEASNKDKKVDYSTDFLDSIGMDSKEFESARVFIAPVGGSIEIGNDKSLIQAFGAHERLSAYAAIRTLIDLTLPEDTTLIIFYPNSELKSKKFQLERITRDALGLVINTVLQDNSESTVKEVLQISRILDLTQLNTKSEQSDSTQSGGGSFAVGRGPILDTGAQSESNTRSIRLLELIRHKLEHDSVPFTGSRKGYALERDNTIGAAFSKSVSETLLMSAPALGNEGARSAISKLDLWATYRAILAYLTY